MVSLTSLLLPVVVSAVPTLESQAWGRLITPSRGDERDGWPKVDVIDRRDDVDDDHHHDAV